MLGTGTPPPAAAHSAATPADTVVELSGISKLYGDFPAVRRLDLSVARGEILGLVGHNGAGKTTTLKMLAGLVAPTTGCIRVMGIDMAREATRAKGFIGYLPEESPFYENMTVTEYLAFFGELYRLPRRVVRERTEELLGALKLPERDRLTGELSKGMKRKVAIARALLHDPALLVLDEPNSGLDPLTSFFIIDYLRELRKKGKTIILSAHNLFHVEYICDRVAILKDGELVVCDTMEAIRRTLGEREYEVTFSAPADLPYPKVDGNYVFRSPDAGQLAGILRQVSDSGWALVDLSIRQSALEDIYVKLMSGTTA